MQQGTDWKKSLGSMSDAALVRALRWLEGHLSTLDDQRIQIHTELNRRHQSVAGESSELPTLAALPRGSLEYYRGIAPMGHVLPTGDSYTVYSRGYGMKIAIVLMVLSGFILALMLLSLSVG